MFHADNIQNISPNNQKKHNTQLNYHQPLISHENNILHQGSAWDAVILPHIEKHNDLIASKYHYLMEYQGKFDINSAWMASSPQTIAHTNTPSHLSTINKNNTTSNEKHQKTPENKIYAEKTSSPTKIKKNCELYTITPQKKYNPIYNTNSSFKLSPVPGSIVVEDDLQNVWVNNWVTNIFSQLDGNDFMSISPDKANIKPSNYGQYSQKKQIQFKYSPLKSSATEEINNFSVMNKIIGLEGKHKEVEEEEKFNFSSNKKINNRKPYYST